VEGEINALRREERDRNITGGFADAHVSNGISPAPEMHLYGTDIARIEGTAVKRPVDVISDRPGKQRPGNACEDRNHKHENGQSAPAQGAFARGRGLPLRRSLWADRFGCGMENTGP